MMRARVLLVILVAASQACGGAPRAAPRSDETTETWTSGDDDALGITAPPADAGTAVPPEK